MSDAIIWKRIRGEVALKGVRKLIKDTGCNTYSGPRPDKNGNLIITMGHDSKPDSDWGRYSGHRAALWFASEELAKAGEAAVRKALGWPASVEE